MYVPFMTQNDSFPQSIPALRKGLFGRAIGYATPWSRNAGGMLSGSQLSWVQAIWNISISAFTLGISS